MSESWKTFGGRALLRRSLPILSIVVLALGTAVACTPEAEERTERSAERTEDKLEEAGRDARELGRELGDELAEAGEALARGAERVGEEIEPFARDAEITAKIKSKLTADPEVNPFTIDVDTVNGRVTLNGVVRTEGQRAEAEKHARSTEGVVEVTTLLEVGEREG
ncbi:MAG TPA: BON domain-containing protein [Thermoanaerobaculia bacterium]|nr:BON domain-containing protein [Thermoanaerobaculia bacterium]